MKDAKYRLLSKIDKKGTDECWPYLEGLTSKGYGQFWYDGSNMNASRAAYILLVGDPGDLFVCHTCDNRVCCNPNHLFLGTQKDNIRDCWNKGRGVAHFKGKKGSKHPLYRAKLTVEQVKEARYMRYELGHSVNDIAAHFGMSASQMSRVTRGEQWKFVK